MKVDKGGKEGRGVVVAHLGSSVGSLIAAPDSKPAVLGSDPAISPAFSGLTVLRRAAFWGWNFTVDCPLWGGRGVYIQKNS